MSCAPGKRVEARLPIYHLAVLPLPGCFASLDVILDNTKVRLAKPWFSMGWSVHSQLVNVESAKSALWGLSGWLSIKCLLLKPSIKFRPSIHVNKARWMQLTTVLDMDGRTLGVY